MARGGGAISEVTLEETNEGGIGDGEEELKEVAFVIGRTLGACSAFKSEIKRETEAEFSPTKGHVVNICTSY